MQKVKARDFGLRCVSSFAEPKPYNEEFIRKFVSDSLREFASYGIGAQHFAKNEGDRLFGYGVSFSLFNGNANFVLSRDGLVSSLLNGQNEQDADLIKELLRRAHHCLPELEKVGHIMTGFCHAEFVEGSSAEMIFKDLVAVQGPAKCISVSVLSNGPQEALAPVTE